MRPMPARQTSLSQPVSECTTPFRLLQTYGILVLLVLIMSVSQSRAKPLEPIAPEQIVNAGHKFFGTISQGLATIVERSIKSYGQPNGYILGEEGSGAFVGGVRYGEGVLYTKNAGEFPVYWQGPSLGFDFGANGSRVMVLVYNLPSTDALFRRFAGVSGSAYVVGGLSASVASNHNIYLVPVRAGVGARLGINVGYLKVTRKPTWNPF